MKSDKQGIAGVAVLAGVIAGWPLVALATEHAASSASEVAELAARVTAGDTIVIPDGIWRDQSVVFRARGTAQKAVTLRAATPGRVVLTGCSSLVIDGEYSVVTGLVVDNGSGTGDGVRLAGRSNRLTECAVVGGNHKFFVHFFGSSNRMDHCYLADKTNDSPTLQVEVEGRPNHHRIDHNHFGLRPPLGRNGGETIRVGYSHQSMTNSGAVVEFNLFDRCDGELEIISSKSCENVYRGNTFLDCAGTLTLRHGNRCVVEGNVFLGHHKPGTGGIRVIGEDHVIVDNYLEGIAQGGFWITAGIPNSELKGYFQARRCVIAFNTIVDSTGPCLQLDAGMGSSGRTLRPENITIATNLFSPGTNGTVIKGTEGAGWTWRGNTAKAAVAHEGVSMGPAEMVRGADGLLRPSANGGRPSAGILRRADGGMGRPVMAADVGPAWRK